MVRSPAKPKESKWSYLRARPRLYNKPTHRSFKVIWDSPDVLGKAQSSPCDAVPPSFSTSSGSMEAVTHYTPNVLSGFDSELDEDPLAQSVQKVTLVPSSGKALSAEPLSNLPPSKPSELSKDLRLDNEHSPISEAHQKADGARQSCLSKHNGSQASAEDKKASKRSLRQLHVSFDDQRKYLEHKFINNEVQSDKVSPVIPKLQEGGLMRNGKRDAQRGTESPVISKLQESAQAKKPKMDTHDLQLSPAVATVQKHAQRKKRKRPKVWVQVQLYDQPSGLRTKADMTMYDIYLSLALEIIEENSSVSQRKKKKVMEQFYEEVAKDAIEIIDELQVCTNELKELQQEIRKMTDLRKKLDRISRGLGKYVNENNIKNVDPYQFYFQDEEEEDNV
ncbi:hypothetical protein MTO96_011605 [Rhipicephalus appendiculatus]